MDSSLNEDIEKLYSNLDFCIIGIKTFTKKKSLFEGGKKREERFSIIKSCLSMIYNQVTSHPELRCVCLEGVYHSIFIDLLNERKNFPADIITLAFQVLQVCCSDSHAVKMYLAFCEMQNLPSIFWCDGFLSTVFHCHDEEYGVEAMKALYYMLYNLDCFHLFQSEGCIPDLILLAEDRNALNEESVPNLANKILEKILIEGKEQALLLFNPYELLQLTASSNDTARMSALMLISNILDAEALLPSSISEYREDATVCNCQCKLMNNDFKNCLAVFIQFRTLYIYEKKQPSRREPLYKIGLENVYVDFGSSETEQNLITLYLPGENPVILRFLSIQSYERWKERLSHFPKYDVNNYPFRYNVEYYHPYYNIPFVLSGGPSCLPINDLLTQLKVLLQSEGLIAEMCYCVFDSVMNEKQIIRILYLLSVGENSVDMLIRNDVLQQIIKLLTSTTVDMISKRQNKSQYDYIVRVNSADLACNSLIYLIYLFHMLVCDPQVVVLINTEYHQVFGHLIEILIDPNYSQVSVLLLHTLSQMISYFSVDQQIDYQNVLLLANRISDIYTVCNRHVKEAKGFLVIRSITTILKHLSRFGGTIIDILNKHKTLEFLLNLETIGSNEVIEQTKRRSIETLNSLYGTVEGVRSLSLYELNSLLTRRSYYALFNSLSEINRRVDGIVKDLSLYLSNTERIKKVMSSVSSFRRSLSSVSILSIHEEEDDLFESDFLFKSNHFSQNREGEINQIMLNAQQAERNPSSTAIKRALRSSYQSNSTLQQINEDEDVELSTFGEITKTIIILRDILTTCCNGGYEDLRLSICIMCASILKAFSTNPHLCTLIWDERIIYTVITIFGSLRNNQHLDDDDCLCSLGCFLISFFSHYQGDINNLWKLKDQKAILILIRIVSHKTISSNTRGIFIYLFAVLLRCTNLQEDFISNHGLKFKGYYTNKNDLIMQGIAYLFGLLGQNEAYRTQIIELWPELPSILCNLNGLSDDVVAAYLFALNSFILGDYCKSLVIGNEHDIFSNILSFERGYHRDYTPVSNLISKRASILLNYLFICNDDSQCIEDLPNSLLLSILQSDVLLAINCSLKMLNDRLHYGSPPCRDFAFYPLKTDMVNVKSNSRRTVWTTYEAILQHDRLLLYLQNSSHCVKAFSLEDVTITQNPEGFENSIKITNKHLNESSKIISFSNNDDMATWQMLIFSIINSRSPLHSITECIRDQSNSHIITDFTTYGLHSSFPATKIWGNSTIIQPSDITDEVVKKLIILTESSSVFTAFQAMRALSTILTSTHSISHDVLQSFINSINRSNTSSHVMDTDFLMRQGFYKVKKGNWICPVCLNNNHSYFENCDCCNSPHYFSLTSTDDVADSTYKALSDSYKKYLLICLLVLSTNPEFCKEFGKKEIHLALENMVRDPYLIVIGSKLICNILSGSHRGYDSDIANFLKEEFIYVSIRTMLAQLTTSHRTVFILHALVNLIHAISYYDISIRRIFTERNGIEITLQLFNYTLPATIHENIVQFTTPLIKDLWCGDEGQEVLSSCSVYQLMELILWSARNEFDDHQSKKSVGENAMAILNKYAQGNNVHRMTEQQDILLKFGVPRLLIIFADVVSYGRFIHLKHRQHRLAYCERLLSIIQSLCKNLTPNVLNNLLQNGICHILLLVIRSPWIPFNIRRSSIEVLIALLKDNNKAVNNTIKEEPQLVSSLFCYMNDRFQYKSLCKISKEDEKELCSIHYIFFILSSVGATVLQMLKANILFYLILFIRSESNHLQFSALQILNKMICKQASFFGSALMQSFSIETLYHEILSLFQRVYSAEKPSHVCILCINCIVHLSFSFKRKLLITEEFFSSLINMRDFPAGNYGSHSYSHAGSLEVLLSNNRDGASLAHNFNTDTLIKLLSIKSEYIQFVALSVLLSRLQLTIRPRMEMLPSSYPNTTLHILNNREINARAYLSPCCIYVYHRADNAIVCERLDYTCMDITKSGNSLSLIPHTELHLKQNTIRLDFSEGEDVCSTWFDKMKNNNIVNIELYAMRIKQAEAIYDTYRNNGIFAVSQSSKTITHPLFHMIKKEDFKMLIKAIGDLKINNKYPNRQVTYCCDLILNTIRLIQEEMINSEALKWITDSDLGIEPIEKGVNNWSLNMPPPPVSHPHF